jgi:hypothetical protein
VPNEKCGTTYCDISSYGEKQWLLFVVSGSSTTNQCSEEKATAIMLSHEQQENDMQKTIPPPTAYTEKPNGKEKLEAEKESSTTLK